MLNSNPRFEVDVGTAVDKQASDGRVAVMRCDVERREPTLKPPHTAWNVLLQYTRDHISLLRDILVLCFDRERLIRPRKHATEKLRQRYRQRLQIVDLDLPGLTVMNRWQLGSSLANAVFPRWY